MCTRGLYPILVCTLTGGSVSGSSQGSRLLDSVGLPEETLSPPGCSILPYNSSVRFPKLNLMIANGTLNLFQSVAEWNLSEDS